MYNHNYMNKHIVEATVFQTQGEPEFILGIVCLYP